MNITQIKKEIEYIKSYGFRKRYDPVDKSISWYEKNVYIYKNNKYPE